MAYFIEKEIIYSNEYILLYVFIKDNELEKFEYKNPEHEKRSLTSYFVPEKITEDLKKFGIDQVVESYQLVYRLEFEETIDYFRQILKVKELQEIIDFMDSKIEFNIYTCIDIDAYLN
ncbi:hypothetical protein [Pedobacter sp. L105]|uniref:hypothetical protein n=1 Tax=Pedobacter sp. L105 TaxID=1641871 RepID=UPI00131A8C96|nr:hypothetical protein [Pedobacter sp. L105]